MDKVGHERLSRSIWLLLLVLLAADSVQAEGAAEARVRVDLERFLRAKTEDASATIEVPRLATFSVDRTRHPGTLRTELSSKAEAPYSGRVPVTVALFAGDTLVKRSVVSPYIRTLISAVVPNRDLRRGEIVTADDLVIVDHDTERMPVDAIGRLNEAIGLRVKRSIRKGRVLRQAHVEGVPVVERGDRVTLVLRSGLIEIQAIGRSKESGAAGDWIRVLNLDSKRELAGRVDRNGLVHVAF